MNVYIVPNELSKMLYEIVDKAIETVPKMKDHREELYKMALSSYNDTGKLPTFSIRPIK